MQAQRAAPLGHVDDAVNKVGHLLDQGGELVHDDHQAGRGVRVTGLLQLGQVLDLLTGEQLLAVGELGGERDQRPLDQVRAQVGD